MKELAQLATLFAGLSLLAVGGGSTALPEMQRQVALHGWVDSGEFCRLYNLGQLAPGPNTLLFTMALGQRAAGWVGALVVGLAFILPPCLLALAAGRLWKRLAGSRWRQVAQDAMAPLTVGLMLTGTWLIARTAVCDLLTLALAGGAACLLLSRRVSPSALILGAGALQVLIGS